MITPFPHLSFSHFLLRSDGSKECVPENLYRLRLQAGWLRTILDRL